MPATVNGFGAVFTDVDLQGNARILCYDKSGAVLPPGSLEPAAANNGLSFIGVSYNAGERITRCNIVSGNARLVAGNVDVGANGLDVVAMDDFIYSEPHAAEFHSTDFDGDGAADLAVFRPTTGQWFIVNSGTNTFSVVNFGAKGDIPINGDFDGDARADLAVFRPADNNWFRLNSSNGGFVVQSFGAAGDRPVAADYDKDGKNRSRCFPAFIRPILYASQQNRPVHHRQLGNKWRHPACRGRTIVALEIKQIGAMQQHRPYLLWR